MAQGLNQRRLGQVERQVNMVAPDAVAPPTREAKPYDMAGAINAILDSGMGIVTTAIKENHRREEIAYDAEAAKIAASLTRGSLDVQGNESIFDAGQRWIGDATNGYDPRVAQLVERKVAGRIQQYAEQDQMLAGRALLREGMNNVPFQLIGPKEDYDAAKRALEYYHAEGRKWGIAADEIDAAVYKNAMTYAAQQGFTQRAEMLFKDYAPHNINHATQLLEQAKNTNSLKQRQGFEYRIAEASTASELDAIAQSARQGDMQTDDKTAILNTVAPRKRMLQAAVAGEEYATIVNALSQARTQVETLAVEEMLKSAQALTPGQRTDLTIKVRAVRDAAIENRQTNTINAISTRMGTEYETVADAEKDIDLAVQGGLITADARGDAVSEVRKVISERQKAAKSDIKRRVILGASSAEDAMQEVRDKTALGPDHVGGFDADKHSDELLSWLGSWQNRTDDIVKRLESADGTIVITPQHDDAIVGLLRKRGFVSGEGASVSVENADGVFRTLAPLDRVPSKLATQIAGQLDSDTTLRVAAGVDAYLSAMENAPDLLADLQDKAGNAGRARMALLELENESREAPLTPTDRQQYAQEFAANNLQMAGSIISNTDALALVDKDALSEKTTQLQRRKARDKMRQDFADHINATWFTEEKYRVPIDLGNEMLDYRVSTMKALMYATGDEVKASTLSKELTLQRFGKQVHPVEWGGLRYVRGPEWMKGDKDAVLNAFRAGFKDQSALLRAGELMSDTVPVFSKPLNGITFQRARAPYGPATDERGNILVVRQTKTGVELTRVAPPADKPLGPTSMLDEIKHRAETLGEDVSGVINDPRYNTMYGYGPSADEVNAIAEYLISTGQGAMIGELNADVG